MNDFERLDDVLVTAHATVTNVGFGENSFAQVVLPVLLGGLLTRMANDIAFSVFISPFYRRGLVDDIYNKIPLQNQ